MSLIKEICEELGVEVGEGWLANDGFNYKIDEYGQVWEWNDEHEEWIQSHFNLGHIVIGEIKPVWKPKHGTTYYIPDIFVKGLCIAERWDNLDKDYMYLKRGLVFETEEDAVIMANQILNFIKEERDNE